MSRPNVLFLMTDQQRFDTICALGNEGIYTPNYDRLVRRGVSFTRAYSSCPVCIPARYNIRTGRDMPTLGVYKNSGQNLVDSQPKDMEERCGPFLGRRMTELGYRTFGIGKFHAAHREVGFQRELRSEELYGSPEARRGDAYASWFAKHFPTLSYVEQLQGERTEMYYMPQTAPMPPRACQEWWAADRAIENIRKRGRDPFFGMVSFIGPHPPCAPPIPFNRLYNPDRMPSPVVGAPEVDHADEQIPWMNRLIWADDISPMQARAVRARYYGEITFIDHCIGRILDAVEARPDADNTVIAFFTDHGDHLGDHRAWQKESFFEQSCHIPMLVSWPGRLQAGRTCDALVSLTDLFGLATGAAGQTETRDGIDLLGVLAGEAPAREVVFGWYEIPGTPQFKVMAREADWKYIYLANGARELLFHVTEDPNELRNLAGSDAPSARSALRRLRAAARDACRTENVNRALTAKGHLRRFPFKARGEWRINQMARDLGVTAFPEHPREVLDGWKP